MTEYTVSNELTQREFVIEWTNEESNTRSWWSYYTLEEAERTIAGASRPGRVISADEYRKEMFS